MENIASGEPQRIRRHSLAELSGLDSPSILSTPAFTHVQSHTTAMHAWTHETQERPYMNMHTQRLMHRYAHTFTQAHVHTWIFLQKYTLSDTHLILSLSVPEVWPTKILFIPGSQGREK